jgi:POT family proton-dependent oligopeptide transporter
MTKFLLDAAGGYDTMTPEQAKVVNHNFVAACYLFPLLGGILADVFWGKYRTIIILSLVYCLGHAVMALIEPQVRAVLLPGELGQWLTPRYCLYLGLGLIALGTGGIKPCVGANVGDQFGSQNKHLVSRVFAWFYFSVNLGSAFSTILTPELLDRFGAGVAFGVPGILMLVATLIFWLGRKQYVHIPPKGSRLFTEIAQDAEGRRAVYRLVVLYPFVAMFWCLFDQTSSAWVVQADSMDRWIDVSWLSGLLSSLGVGDIQGYELKSSQLQAANPFLILVLIPFFTYVGYPAIDRVFPLSPLRKVSLGLFITVASFAVSALIEIWINQGHRPHVAWQGLAYLILTSAEVMVSITCLEFSYTQAPRTMKSVILSVYYLSVSLGNELTSVVNWAIQDETGHSRLTGPTYYWVFTAAMLVTACFFVPVAMNYRGKSYLQDESAA